MAVDVQARQELIEAVLPLTPQQEALLAQSLGRAGDGLCQHRCELEGDLDLEAWREAWRRALLRHETLRVAFVWERRGRPLQVVYRRLEPVCREHDLRGLPPAAAGARLAALEVADRERGFDLHRAPLSRLTLVRLGDREWSLLWSFHPLVLDDGSAAVVLGDVLDAYGALRRGGEPALAPARPFRDYLGWLRLQDEPVAAAFWRARLAGVAPAARLGLGMAADGEGGVPPGRAVVEAVLPPAATAALDAFAARHQLAVDDLVHGAWALLLSRYGGGEAVLYATTAAGRPPELDGGQLLAGPLANLHPVPVRVVPSWTAGRWLRREGGRRRELASFAHVPLARVWEWAGLADGLPETLLLIDRPAVALPDGEGELAVRARQVTAPTGFPLVLRVAPGRRLAARLSFHPARLGTTAATRLLGHFLRLLAGLAEVGERPLSRLPLLSAAERHQLCHEAADGGWWLARWPAECEEFAARLRAESARRRLCVHLLDRHGEPVPGGAVGALWLAADGPAPAGLGRAAAPGARPLRPVAAPDGSWLLDTGHRARRVGDGGLELVGTSPADLREVEDVYLLSGTQAGMLFYRLYDPRSTAYLHQYRLTFEGDLHVEAFVAAWRRLIARHAVFRTEFRWEGLPRPLQQVLVRVDLPFEIHDWSGLAEPERRRRLAAFLRGDRQRGIDLGRAPLMRLALIRLEAAHWQFVWIYHDILIDGWCQPRLMRELRALYQGIAAGVEVALPAVPPYRAFIDWLQRQSLAAGEDFWRRILAGFTAPNRLAVDRAPEGRKAGLVRARSYRRRLSPATTAGLLRLARRLRVTLNTLVQGAWALLLGRFSGDRDVVFGVVSSGRPAELPDVDSIIGLFITTLPLRVGVAPERAPAEWLAAIQRHQLEVRQHEYCPLLQVQEWSEVPSGTPLFDTILIFQNIPVRTAQAAWRSGERLKTQDVRSFQHTSYALSLAVRPREDPLAFSLTADAERFPQAVALRLAGALTALLEAMAEELPPALADLCCLQSAERHQLLREWNDSALAPPRARSWPELFMAQAAATPDAVALACGEAQLSYGALAAAAERIAAALRALGAGPEAVLPVLAERGLDLWLVVLGVLRAGAAYLPLDPRHPPRRLAQVLAGSGARWLLHAEALAGRVGEALAGVGRRVAPLPFAGLLQRAAPAVDAGPPPEPGDLAYVIYTSGSTGVPKGVMVEHHGMLNHLCAKVSDLGLTAADTVAQTASQCFDISVWQLLAPLVAGGRVEVLTDAAAHDPLRLLRETAARGVTVLETVPSLLHGVLDEAARLGATRPGLEALRWLVPTGEELPPELARRWLDAYPRVPLLNAYGPTECSDDVAHHPVRRPHATGLARMPIGRPVANLRLYVVDRDLVPLGAEVPGELVAGGEGVGRGYVGDPGRTAEAFVPDPWSADPGRRLYRTGDLARLLPDGAVEFLGRIDHQVKVRGHRIELPEIEHLLRQLPGVAQAVVVAREDRFGDRRLVAYVVAAAGVEVAVADLRAALAEQLPESMVPSAFVLLPALPLTPNGKLDRGALPAPGPAAAPAAVALEPPPAPVEDVLAAIWCEVLGRDRVGVREDFFALGGHSLLAMQVMSRVASVFGVELPLRELFAAPTVAGLAGRLERQLRAGRPQPPPLLRAPRDGDLPLSFAQERAWVLEQLAPGPAQHLTLAVHLAERVAVPLLARALAEVVRRHEVLRTIVRPVDGRPRPEILPPGRVFLPVVDLGALPAAARRREGRRLADAEARRTFDLTSRPPLRACLLRLKEREQALALTLHGIAADPWSLALLRRELTALYECACGGAEAALPELSLQYADYAAWQRRWLSGRPLEEALAFWRRQLAGLPPVVEAPADRPRPAVQSLRGARCCRGLLPALWPGLVRLARQENASTPLAAVAAVQMLLGRLTGQADLAVGLPLAGRGRPGVQELIGAFADTLVLRGDLTGDPSFRTMLARIREAALAAHLHLEVPFDKLVEALAPERSLAHSPLFQVLVAVAPAEGELEAAPGAADGALAADLGTEPLDLTLTLVESAPGLRARLSYATDLFDRTTALRLLRALEALLEGVVADPDRRLSGLPLLAAAERSQVLREWNDTAAAAEEALCLHELFERRAAARQEAVALRWRDTALSYGELEARSNRLGGFLRALGVGPEVRVGVLLERTPELVVALLAVLKAGGAYVPLDPAHPPARLEAIAGDAGLAVLVGTGELLARLPARSALRRVDLAAEAATIAAAPAARPRSGVDPSNLAYVLFTSGSTGRPKGVAISHRSPVALVRWAGEAFTAEELAGVLAATSVCFDLSVFELFVPLAHGGVVVLVRDVLEVAERADEGWVRLINTVPSAAAELCRAGGLPRSVRTVNLAGEALPRALVEEVYRQAGVTRVVNLYGPSEDTTYSTGAVVARRETGEPPIGRPLPGTLAHVLDADLSPAGVGVRGELYLAGVGQARGYLGRPELTAERFVPDPFAAEPGGRLYRTGDVARHRADGTLEYLGRSDHQVKLRGFRIELGEVEAALAAHAGVEQAAALVREVAGDRRLVAFVAARGEERPEAAELRGWLERRLPSYMVPAAFVTLAALPLTPNGKLDRRALAAQPLPEAAGPGTVSAPGEPAARSPAEELLASIWAEVLGIREERLGLGESFFDLGGHSLLGVRVMARAASAFGVELPLRALFEAPTVKALAAHVGEALAAGRSAQAPPLVRLPRRDELPPSFAQERLWFTEQLAPGPTYNVPLALRSAGPLEAGALAWALGQVVRRHEALRTVFAAVDGRPCQVIRPPLAAALPVVDLVALPDPARRREARSLAEREARRLFDLARGPLLRVLLLRGVPDQAQLLITMHHIVTDDWSVEVFTRELMACYRAAVRREAPALPEPPVQYADFAAWQRRWFAGAVLVERLAYWRRQLAGLPPVLELPLDRPRPPAESHRGGFCAVALPESAAADLRRLGREEEATPFVLAVAAAHAFLGRVTGGTDVVIGAPVSGRGRLELENLVGFFVNALVLRGDLGGDPSFRRLLGRTRELVLEAQAQELPIEKLVEELAPERTLAHAPLVQVTVLVPLAANRQRADPDVEVEELVDATGTEKVDLTLSLVESPRGLRASLSYARDLFDRTTARRLVGQWARLLAAAAAEPERRVGELLLLSPAERWQVVGEWNDAASAYPREAGLAELFASAAVRRWEAVAVVAGEDALSYGELDRRSSRLARRLRRLGVGPERAVGLALERSVELVVGMLGVVKAGGVYVPLDVSYPRERLELMVGEAGVEVVVTRRGRMEGLGRAVRLVGVEQEGPEAGPEEEEEAREETRSWGSSAACVFFTSGSTGRPKGVVVRQGGIARLVLGTNYLALGEQGRMAHASNTSFDASTLEVWGPLLLGGAVVVVGAEASRSPRELLAEVRRQGVTHLFLTTALLHEVARQEPGGLGGLESVIFGGEAAEPRWVGRVVEAGGPRRLVNGYGPTETTTFASWYGVGEEGAAEGTRWLPIGRAVSNTALYVVDGEGWEVGMGVVGELWIGGEGLSRGYLGRPERTAERFVPDPFGGEAGGRLYRTGDYVRCRAGGELEFVGRRDGQVKLRGFRIELGEVEAALASHPGVDQAAVLLREVGGDRRLVAYVVGGEAAAPGGRELREWLGRRLPGYMVPAAYVTLAELPLTPNGKVDRRALAALPVAAAGEGGEEGEERRVERSPVAELVAGIWAEVLGAPEERLAPEASFFELGGHSLLATRVMLRVAAAFGVDLSVRVLFEAPTLAGLAARIETALGAGGEVEAPPLVRVAREGELPLSFAQERLWFLDLLEPGPTYNVPMTLRFTGPLDRGALARALTEEVGRHEALRTVFVAVEGRPRQVIRPPAPAPVPVVDLGGLPEAARPREGRRLARWEARRRFDLARGPLLRAWLARLGPEDHVLLVTMHHIVTDGWSVEVFRREVAALYRAAARGESAELPELPVQYVEYAVWQRRWLSGEVLAGELAYWRRKLAGLPPVLDLPFDRPRHAVGNQRASCRLEVPTETAARLVELLRAQGATRYMAAVAAWQALLSRLTGQTDVVVGSPVSGRVRLELEHLIGFFVNTLVLRGDLAGDPSFRALLGRTREVTLEAHAHQNLPFENLVEELAPQRSLTHSPLFQVMVNFLQRPPRAARRLARRAAPPGIDEEPAAAKFDLTLTVIAAGDELSGSLEYNADLFDRTTAVRLLAHLRQLLAGAVDQPDRPLSELPLLGPAERAQVAREWSHGGGAPAAVFVHAAIAEQAARRPDSTAVATEGSALSFGELDRRANRLAHRLRRLAVGPETRVGVCAERSPELLVGVLAALKAGGAYVPLDPGLPEERLRYVVEDAAAAVVLVGRPLPGLPAGVIQVPLAAPPAASDADPAVPVLPEHPAYVIYTSGSTGRPKGVVVSHASLARYTRTAVAAYHLDAADQVLQFASLSFDASAEEIFPSLACGATLVLRGTEMIDTVAGFLRACERWQLTVLDLPTAYWHEVAAAFEREPPRLPPSLRLVVIGGEQALASHLATWHRHAGTAVRLVNTYGPTEATIVATQRPLLPAPRPSVQVPIGRPVAGVRSVVLGPDLLPAPIGVAGELCLGGAGLARGYLGRPDLTAERFVPDPSGGEPGARLYRTGDRARWRADGVLEFLGRLDGQVKVRGFRVEVGEIEAVLGQHPQVDGCAVLARRDGVREGDVRLVAFVVSPPGELAAPRELRGFLRRHLPESMVPAAFVAVQALPRTSSGKVDRDALAAAALPVAAAGQGGEEGEERRVERSPVEELVAGIWAEVLGLSGWVGSEASFFELGGHSLLATRVMARVAAVFGVELPLRALFEEPTVAGLGGRIETALGAGGGLEAPPLVRVAREGELPLSFAQERLWFLDQLEAGAAYNVPLAVRFGEAVEVGALVRALSGVVGRHEALRTVFTAVEGRPRQVILRPAPVAVPVVELGGLAEALRRREARRLARWEAGRRFDLAAGPLLRVMLVRSGGVGEQLLVTMHHIVTDAWSMEVFRREVQAEVRAAERGERAELPEPAVQYADYAVWQRRWLGGEVLARELGYWREKLRGLPPVLELPLDRPRPAVQSYRGGVCRQELGPEVVAGLERLGRQRGATPFMVTLAGVEALLGRVTGQREVAVGTPVAGRRRVELEGLIGFFVNTLVLRGDLGGDPGFGELVERARETVLEAHAHQELPFERLVEELAPERSLAHAPLFQVMLVLAGGGGAEREGGEGRWAEEGTAGSEKFDLTLAAVARGGRLGLALSYAVELFDRTTARRLVGQWARLLAAAAAEPERRVGELSLLSPAERWQVVGEWNDAGRAASGACLHELFERQAERTPEAVALAWRGTAVSYGELEAQANRLARRLRALGVGAEAPVGVFLRRTPHLVAALLGVLKAGGAYVPLDPAYPAARLEFILDAAAAGVLVTESALASRLPEGAARVEVDAADWAGASAARVAGRALPDQLAYVIYTSGSTGRPKGVAITHRSAAALAEWARQAFSEEELSGVLAATSICFDLSVFELLVPLAWGGRVVLAEDALELPALGDAAVRLVNTVPSAMAELCRLGGVPATVRTVNLAGEPLGRPLVEEVYACPGVVRVVNLYGPSEDTTYSTASEVPVGAAGEPAIGRSLAGRQAYVLDAELRPVPRGVAGELCLGGVGVARGYLGRPERTAERFVPDALGSEPGARLYRTGDRARWRADGELEFLGRYDHQVKVRGFRIEPGEIELALARHSGVREAAVVVREERDGDRRLAAWVVGTAPASELREHLRRTLPAHMVPAAFGALARLPLTPNGKVDRRALERLAAAPLAAAGAAAPRDRLELELVQIYEETLGVAPVGIDDDFFALGGHSLLAVRLLARVRRRCGRELPLSLLFRSATVAALARHLRREAAAPDDAVLVPLETRGAGLPFFCVHPVGGSVFCYLDLARQLGPGFPFFGLQAAPNGDGAPTIAAMAAHYLEAVRSVQPAGPYRLGGWSMGGLVAFEMARQLAGRGERVDLVALFDSVHPAGAGRERSGPLARVRSFARELGVRELARLAVPPGTARAGEPDLLARLFAQARAERLLVDELDQGEVDRLYRVFKANLEAMLSYTGGPYEGRVHLFKAERTAARRGVDPLFGWAAWARGGVETSSFPAHHYSLLRRPAVEAVAARLKDCLR